MSKTPQDALTSVSERNPRAVVVISAYGEHGCSIDSCCTIDEMMVFERVLRQNIDERIGLIPAQRPQIQSIDDLLSRKPS